MSITGQNAILNQFSPKFVLKAPLAGQTLIWDTVINGFTNQSVVGLGTGAFEFAMMKQAYLNNGMTFNVAVPRLSTSMSGSTVTLSISSINPGMSYQILWGDGAMDHGIGYIGIGFTHTYISHTLFTITVNITNPYGVGSTTITVNPFNI